MALFKRPDSPFWWCLLEGHGRKKESTGILWDASSATLRKQNREQAEAIYHARMTQLARSRVGLPPATSTTFTAWAKWFDEHRIAKRQRPSVTRERVMLAHLRGHFGGMLLQEIRPARWTEYETARLKAGASVNTVGRELALMKSILLAAVGEHLEVSPLAHVKRKTVRLPPKRTITAAEEAQLLEALSPGKVRGGTYGDEELRDLYLVGVGTLLRQANLILLRRRAYDRTRLILHTKTGPHQVPLDGPTTLQRRAAMVLKRRLPATHEGFFFPKWAARFSKTPEGANAKFLQAFRRACKRAGIPWGLKQQGLVWHTATRASGATRLLRDYGVDVRTVQLIGGWRSLDQMAEYLGVDLGTMSATPAAKGRLKAASTRRRSA